MAHIGDCFAMKYKSYQPQRDGRPFVPPREGIALLNGTMRVNAAKSVADLTLHMEYASYTIDMYMMCVINLNIIQCLRYMRNQMVQIRVILDEKYRWRNFYAVRELHNMGVSIRWKPASMPHRSRLCLVDTTTTNSDVIPFCLMTPASDNAEVVDNTQFALLITSTMTIFQYQRIFDNMWDKLDKPGDKKTIHLHQYYKYYEHRHYRM